MIQIVEEEVSVSKNLPPAESSVTSDGNVRDGDDKQRVSVRPTPLKH